MPYEDISDINLDCLSIFEESESELHKPGEMKDITVSRYKLSKYLGKMQMLSSLVNDGQKSESYCRSLMGILTPDVLIENWFLWERLLQICLSCETMDAYENTVITIRKAIETMEFGQDC